jgi:hypothetical protein
VAPPWLDCEAQRAREMNANGTDSTPSNGYAARPGGTAETIWRPRRISTATVSNPSAALSCVGRPVPGGARRAIGPESAWDLRPGAGRTTCAAPCDLTPPGSSARAGGRGRATRTSVAAGCRRALPAPRGSTHFLQQEKWCSTAGLSPSGIRPVQARAERARGQARTFQQPWRSSVREGRCVGAREAPQP